MFPSITKYIKRSSPKSKMLFEFVEGASENETNLHQGIPAEISKSHQ